MDGNLIPRLARAVEAAAVQDLVDAAYGHYVARIGRKPGPMLDDYLERIAAGQAWVVDGAEALIALLVLEEADGLLIDNIAITPGHWGQGLGRRLMTFAEQEAARRGLGRIWLYTHILMVENITLYNRLGYRETHRGTEKGYERVYFEKLL